MNAVFIPLFCGFWAVQSRGKAFVRGTIAADCLPTNKPPGVFRAGMSFSWAENEDGVGETNLVAQGQEATPPCPPLHRASVEQI